MFTVFLYIFAGIGLFCTSCFLIFFIMVIASIIYDKFHPGWLEIPDTFNSTKHDE